MTNIIYDLYYGKINTNEGNNKQILEQLDILDHHEKKLKELLSEECRVLFSEYINAWRETSSHSDYENFENGFRLGARFAYDTFAKNDSLESPNISNN